MCRRPLPTVALMSGLSIAAAMALAIAAAPRADAASIAPASARTVIDKTSVVEKVQQCWRNRAWRSSSSRRH